MENYSSRIKQLCRFLVILPAREEESHNPVALAHAFLPLPLPPPLDAMLIYILLNEAPCMHNLKCSCNKIPKVFLNILRIARSPRIFLNVFSMLVSEVQKGSFILYQRGTLYFFR